jgi:hypothetical protein
MTKQFQYLRDALIEEPVVEERIKHTPIIKGEVLASPKVSNHNCVLQFLGWELVLLSNGSYFINDTTGG